MSDMGAAKRNDEITIDDDGTIHFPRIIVGGLPVAALDRRETARLTISAALARRSGAGRCAFFTTTNGQVVSLCASNSEVKHLFEQASLISADGMSVVFASRLGPGRGLPERVATTDAFHDAAQLAEERGVTFYFFGGTEEVNARATERALTIYPRLKIVGRRHGYFRPEDETGIVDHINAAAPDILWVGLGVPNQQRFVLGNLHRLISVGVAKSCGGLFDFLAGRNKRAPWWMQQAGLEWAFRAWQEPGRLAARYLTTNPHAAYWLLRERGVASEGVIEARTRF
jgi:N-acetylglucosaminyldiphosphoundecaprenol N-acetyl-beta-D-mannosaminyltransferase